MKRKKREDVQFDQNKLMHNARLMGLLSKEALNNIELSALILFQK